MLMFFGLFVYLFMIFVFVFFFRSYLVSIVIYFGNLYIGFCFLLQEEEMFCVMTYISRGDPSQCNKFQVYISHEDI